MNFRRKIRHMMTQGNPLMVRSAGLSLALLTAPLFTVATLTRELWDFINDALPDLLHGLGALLVALVMPFLAPLSPLLVVLSETAREKGARAAVATVMRALALATFICTSLWVILTGDVGRVPAICALVLASGALLVAYTPEVRTKD